MKDKLTADTAPPRESPADALREKITKALADVHGGRTTCSPSSKITSRPGDPDVDRDF